MHSKFPYALIILAATLSCREAITEMPTSTRMFYFDALALSGGGKVFAYEPVNDKRYPEEYWHKRFTGDYHANTLYRTLYSPDAEVLQSMAESIDKKGATLIKLELTYPSGDSSRTLTAKIDAASTFLFGPPDTTVIAKYQIEYREPSDDAVRVILTRERKFVREQTFTFQGKEYPAMRFVVDETLETETEGFTESTWQTTEIYALGLGLVYYRKPINSEFVLEYRLKDMMEYHEFMGGKR
jgi:hypothetical protein